MNLKYTAQNIIEHDFGSKMSSPVRRILTLFLSFIAGVLLIILDYFVKEIKMHDATSAIVKNSGITWGVGAQYPLDDVNRFIPFVIAIGIFLLFYIAQTFVVYKEMNPKERYFWTLGGLLVLAGAIANLIDRIRLGYIVDYIFVWKFPPLNLADLYIVTGTCWLVSLVLLKGRRLKNVFSFWK